MQPRYPFPGMPPVGSGVPPGMMPPQMPGFHPQTGFPPAPVFYPPGSMPPHMMHPGMHMHMGMPPTMPAAMPPPPMFNSQAYAAPAAPVPPKPASSVIVGTLGFAVLVIMVTGHSNIVDSTHYRCTSNASSGCRATNRSFSSFSCSGGADRDGVRHQRHP